MAVSHRKFSICSAVCAANSTVELEILIYPAAATVTAVATAADSDSDSDGRGTAIFGTALISLRFALLLLLLKTKRPFAPLGRTRPPPFCLLACVFFEIKHRQKQQQQYDLLFLLA